MGYHKKMFLLYGTTFAVVGLTLDAIKGEADPYWFVDVIIAYVTAAIPCCFVRSIQLWDK